MRIRWAWWALALFALLLVAQETRYAHSGTVDTGKPVVVWDRWTHRYCMIQPGHGWLCGVALR